MIFCFVSPKVGNSVMVEETKKVRITLNLIDYDVINYKEENFDLL